MMVCQRWRSKTPGRRVRRGLFLLSLLSFLSGTNGILTFGRFAQGIVFSLVTNRFLSFEAGIAWEHLFSLATDRILSFYHSSDSTLEGLALDL